MTVNDKLVFSKQKAGAFPKYKSVSEISSS